MNVHFPQGELACSESYGIGKSLSCFCSVIFISPFFFLLFPFLLSFSLLKKFFTFSLSCSLFLTFSLFLYPLSFLPFFFLFLSSLPLPLSQYQHRISISSLRMVLLSVVLYRIMLCQGLYSYSGISSLRSEFPCHVIISSDFM